METYIGKMACKCLGDCYTENIQRFVSTLFDLSVCKSINIVTEVGGKKNIFCHFSQSSVVETGAEMLSYERMNTVVCTLNKKMFLLCVCTENINILPDKIMARYETNIYVYMYLYIHIYMYI